jgi:ferrous iron transport protein B
MNRALSIALVGQPNCGKTTIFNALTGGRQHVGNYSGVTVERHTGTCSWKDAEIEITDLPGAHSLTASSVDETIVQKTLLEERFDVLVNVIDSTKLTRSLYLTVQLLNLGFPVILALNMSDEAETKGIFVDVKQLEKLTGCAVVQTVGRLGKGMDELRAAVLETVQRPFVRKIPDWNYHGDEHMRRAVTKLSEELSREKPFFPSAPSSEWIAVKLLERDTTVTEEVLKRFPALQTTVQQQIGMLEAAQGESSEEVVSDFRYGIINALVQACQRQAAPSREDITRRVDRVITHRIWGLPIFFLIMYAMFALTFIASEPLMHLLESAFASLGALLGSWWPEARFPELRSLALDGVLGGVCGVLVFLPNILMLFLCLALIEGTGYMARAAFIMDRAMRAVGLQGKSFIPLVIGFGCSVPAIMATRMIESRRDRLATLFIVPLMSCGAKLPIYSLIIAAFFTPVWRAPVLLSVYIIGVLAAFAVAALMRKTVFKGESSLFILELPPYRLPTLKSVGIHLWERAQLYIYKAGTIILVASIIFWAATTYPKTGHPEDTVSGRVGYVLEPVMRHIGFDWHISSALVGAFAAKEVFVSQLAILAAVDGEKPLRQFLQERYSPLQGYVLMIFCLMATPCVATFATVRKETQSWGWAFAQQGAMTLLAYCVCFVIYQLGCLLF